MKFPYLEFEGRSIFKESAAEIIGDGSFIEVFTFKLHAAIAVKEIVEFAPR